MSDRGPGRAAPTVCAPDPAEDDDAFRAELPALRRASRPAPTWVAPLFCLFALALVPWTVYLAATLPRRVVSHHWDLAWVGFDAALGLALAGTAWTAYRRSPWIPPVATAAATLLCCDAWFDMVTAPTRTELLAAVGEAALVELPLAATCLWIARHAEQVNERAALVFARRLARLARRERRGPNVQTGANN